MQKLAGTSLLSKPAVRVKTLVCSLESAPLSLLDPLELALLPECVRPVFGRRG